MGRWSPVVNQSDAGSQCERLWEDSEEPGENPQQPVNKSRNPEMQPTRLRPSGWEGTASANAPFEALKIQH